MQMCLHAHSILFSPTGVCVQISVWMQSKLNYSFLGKKPPVENLFGRAASFIIFFFSPAVAPVCSRREVLEILVVGWRCLGSQQKCFILAVTAAPGTRQSPAPTYRAGEGA